MRILIGIILVTLLAVYIVDYTKDKNDKMLTQENNQFSSNEIEWYTLPDGRMAFDVSGQTIAVPQGYLVDKENSDKTQEYTVSNFSVSKSESEFNSRLLMSLYLPIKNTHDDEYENLRVGITLEIRNKGIEIINKIKDCNSKDTNFDVGEFVFLSSTESTNRRNYCAPAVSRSFETVRPLVVSCWFLWEDRPSCSVGMGTKDGKISLQYKFNSISPYIELTKEFKTFHVTIDQWKEVDRRMHELITSIFINYKQDDWQ